MEAIETKRATTLFFKVVAKDGTVPIMALDLHNPASAYQMLPLVPGFMPEWSHSLGIDQIIIAHTALADNPISSITKLSQVSVCVNGDTSSALTAIRAIVRNGSLGLFVNTAKDGSMVDVVQGLPWNVKKS